MYFVLSKENGYYLRGIHPETGNAEIAGALEMAMLFRCKVQNGKIVCDPPIPEGCSYNDWEMQSVSLHLKTD
jgi:hypothetical protein